MEAKKWRFWIDRGGTFTDVVALSPEQTLITHKLLSQDNFYYNSAIEGIRVVLGLKPTEALPTEAIAEVRMGTTLGTNALLEKTGSQVALVITAGLGDALRIGYQNRPDLFALAIHLPEVLYESVIEVEERYSANGEVLCPLDLTTVHKQLRQVYQRGIRSIAIVLMHGYRFPQHEQAIAEQARVMGFSQISVSHEVSPLPKLVSRGNTTVVDAYLTPVLRDYIDGIVRQLGDSRLFFMQSHGGLAHHAVFRGRDSILSGPAAGVVGSVQTAQLAGFHYLINFDMGGTSTDVSHWAGEYDRDFDTEVAGVRLQTPMMRIHTVAAGGGSICYFDGLRVRVGPHSAGANPGPAAYGKGGPLTVTDCNIMLGKLHSRFFPRVFGHSGQEPLDETVVHRQFTALASEINQTHSPLLTTTQIAEGFITIAVNHMATAIKKISVQRGYDVTQYTLCCFGGAGGQHACLVAEALDIKTIFIHPQAGVLSALGMGLAEVRSVHEQALTQPLTEGLMPEMAAIIEQLAQNGRNTLIEQAVAAATIQTHAQVHLRYAGTDTPILVDFSSYTALNTQFAQRHQQQYGFVRPQTTLIVEAVSVEAIGNTLARAYPSVSEPERKITNQPIDRVLMVSGHETHMTPVYRREHLTVGFNITGPAIIIDNHSTTVVEVYWQAEITPRYELILTRQAAPKTETVTTEVNPVMLEVFNHLLMSIAEQMGTTLAKTAYSVNIKERLDFSCAIFDQGGQLIANAPHVPVHLGSMEDSVSAVIAEPGAHMQPGDVFVLNNPFSGGTHLPDVTVVTPVFLSTDHVLFYVASRGHHADIGGMTPGSMPAHSQTLAEEGVIINVFKLVAQGQFRETELRTLLTQNHYPARNIEHNLADLRAQIAANVTGVRELRNMVQHFGLEMVQAYMCHVQMNAEVAVRQLLTRLQSGQFCYPLDNGAHISVRITIDAQQRSAVIDFSDSSPQQPNNFNAPRSICKAAVLYVFRTLIQDQIPLNAGCLKPLTLIIPPGSLLNPESPAAVVAGNVETSQCIVDTLYAALGVMAASQGTMNNFTFGNQHYQYYETICGGAGAGPDFVGASAVHTHMTNSRITDPELLEWRFPVLLETFAIRHGSGGAGRYYGGDGVVRRIRFFEPMTVSILSARRHVPPYGMAGGKPGQVGKNTLIRATGEHIKLAATVTVEVQVDDVIVIETPGGGGYGDMGSNPVQSHHSSRAGY